MKNIRRSMRWLAALCAVLLLVLPLTAGADTSYELDTEPLIGVYYRSDDQSLLLICDQRMSRVNRSLQPKMTVQTFSVSAVEGVHFQPLSITPDWGFNHVATVPIGVVPIARGSDSEPGDWYQTGETRVYGVRIIDEGGYELWRGYFPLNNGGLTQYAPPAVRSAEGLLYISDGTLQTSQSLSGLCTDTDTTDGSFQKVTDSGYGQLVRSLPLGGVTAGHPIDYLGAAGVKIAAAVGYMMKEGYDGYQYIQILADSPTAFDDVVDDYGNDIYSVPDLSLYKACFEYSSSNSAVSTDGPMVFPHGSNTGFPRTDTELYRQDFKAGAQAAGSFALLLEPDTEELNVRFDASGKDKDDWYFRDLFARCVLLDTEAPELKQTIVAGGRYTKGNTLIVTLRFDEIVNADGTSLNTSWGPLNAVSGGETGYSNVVTYSGTIDSTASGQLKVNGVNGTIRDMAGNAFTFGNTAVSTGKTLDPVGTYGIAYLLNGGTADNPATFTETSAPITLNAPTRPGYDFTGWTGSPLDSLTQSVTIPTGTRGWRVYEANWSILTYDITCDLNGGTLSEANPETYNVETDDITLNNPTLAGYDFVGWTVTGITGDPVETVTIPKGSTGDRAYTANWSRTNYSITCELNGGTLSAANPSSYHIDSESITLVNPTRSGYVFTGWTGTELNGLTETVTIPHGSTGARIYTANWEYLPYQSWTGSKLEDTPVPPDAVTLNDDSTIWTGTVLAEGSVVIDRRVIVDGSATLILLDGCSLTVPQGITVNESDSLTICGQNKVVSNQGSLTVTAPPALNAGIGGSSDSDGRNAHDAGHITVLGGRVTVTGNDSGAGIGGSEEHNGDYIVIRGGAVTATGKGSAGIGGGLYGHGTVTITGGDIEATASARGAGIGGGDGGNGTVTITGGDIEATASGHGAGIGGGDGGNGMVTITGGDIEATASAWGAGIGGGYGDNGTVTITGGDIKATASDVGAGIGSGYNGNVTVTITGGKITAASGTEDKESSSAAIGSGYSGSSTVLISGGEVHAEAYSDTAAIGGTRSAVTVSGGTVVAESKNGKDGIGGSESTLVLTWETDAQGAPIPCSVTANRYGSVTLMKPFANADNASQSFQMGTHDIDLNGLTLVPSTAFPMYRDYENGGYVSVPIPADAQLLTADSLVWSGCVYAFGAVAIEDRVTVSGSAKLILLDGCSLTVPRGVTVNESDSLTICGQNKVVSSQGSLTVTSPPALNAGIGGSSDSDGRNAHDAGHITILGGRVTVTGNEFGAGIGGSESHNGDYIVIRGGAVTAAGKGSAGIGGGLYGHGTVTISGGNVTAASTGFGAGIGGGNGGNGTVTITGGDIEATASGHAAGIGGGYSGNGTVTNGTVTISGGDIEATASAWGAGIGGGSGGNGTVTITGGDIEATASDVGAGIGGGFEGNCTVTITSGKTTAASGTEDNRSSSAAIGSGCYGSSTVLISGGEVHAEAYSNTAAIGGNLSTVTVSGGTVVAESKNGLDGIGGFESTVILTWEADAQGAPIPCSVTANRYVIYGSVTLGKPFFYRDENGMLRVICEGQAYIAERLAGKTVTSCDPSALPAFGTPAFKLPAALTAIGQSAFEGNGSLTVVDAGGCTAVGKYAFRNCTGLTQIRVSLNCRIDSHAFDGCTSLIAVYGPAGGKAEEDALLAGIPFVPIPAAQ